MEESCSQEEADIRQKNVVLNWLSNSFLKGYFLQRDGLKNNEELFPKQAKAVFQRAVRRVVVIYRSCIICYTGHEQITYNIS